MKHDATKQYHYIEFLVTYFLNLFNTKLIQLVLMEINICKFAHCNPIKTKKQQNKTFII